MTVGVGRVTVDETDVLTGLAVAVGPLTPGPFAPGVAVPVAAGAVVPMVAAAEGDAPAAGVSPPPLLPHAIAAMRTEVKKPP